MLTNIKIGSRDSMLALIQAEFIKAELEQAYPDYTFEIIKVKTQGDKILDTALSKIGDKGLFVKELETQLLNNSIDLAVHSMKDLMTTLPDGLELAATTAREDVRDVVCLSNHALERGVKGIADAQVIASSSLRRVAQLKALYPNKEFVDIRGNLNTRFRKLDDKSNGIDALILAAAGMHRISEHDLSFVGRITEYLDPVQVLPAVGQGALAIEISSAKK